VKPLHQESKRAFSHIRARRLRRRLGEYIVNYIPDYAVTTYLSSARSVGMERWFKSRSGSCLPAASLLTHIFEPAPDGSTHTLRITQDARKVGNFAVIDGEKGVFSGVDTWPRKDKTPAHHYKLPSTFMAAVLGSP
jgi:hypothetical protein